MGKYKCALSSTEVEQSTTKPSDRCCGWVAFLHRPAPGPCPGLPSLPPCRPRLCSLTASHRRGGDRCVAAAVAAAVRQCIRCCSVLVHAPASACACCTAPDGHLLYLRLPTTARQQVRLIYPDCRTHTGQTAVHFVRGAWPRAATSEPAPFHIRPAQHASQRQLSRQAHRHTTDVIHQACCNALCCLVLLLLLAVYIPHTACCCSQPNTAA